MDGLTSPARFLAYLMAEHDISITQLCRRSGMDSADAWVFLGGAAAGDSGTGGAAGPGVSYARILAEPAGAVGTPAV